MKYLCLFALLALTMNLAAQSPVKATFAYSRATVSGIPPAGRGAASAPSPFPATYFIYVVVKKGTEVSANTACVEGKLYAATLKKVAAPVIVEHDVAVPTGQKDTLVQPTPDDVYQVELQQRASRPCDLHAQDKLALSHGVVVRLQAGGSAWCAAARKIVPLPPAAAP